MACFGLLLSLGDIGESWPGNEPVDELDEALAETNSSAPRMVADHVRFDRPSRDGRSFIVSSTGLKPPHSCGRIKKKKVRAEHAPLNKTDFEVGLLKNLPALAGSGSVTRIL
jgi:hypothetical protein